MPRVDGHPAAGHLLLALAGLVLVVLGGLVADGGDVGSAEESLFHAVNDLPGWLYQPLWGFQQCGNIVVAVLIGVVAALALGQRAVAIAVVAAAGLKLLLEDVVKDVVQRSRPGTSIGGDVHLRGDVSEGGLSYVSGHATITTAVAGLLTPILPGRWKVVPWVVVAGNAFGRVYVGAHNPVDVVGGFGLGLVIAGLLNAALLATTTRRSRLVSRS